MSARPAPSVLTQPVFTSDTPAPARLLACRTYLESEGRRIQEQHQAGAPGRKIAAALADRMDGLLVTLFTTTIAGWRQLHGEPPFPICLVALGGYGRHELSPLSDVDVMLLHQGDAKSPHFTKFQEYLTNGILYPLWDLKLKIGHSSRALNEVFTEAANDIKTKTALLESRLIAGSETLYDNFAEAYRKHYLQTAPKAYIAARLLDQGNRRAQHGDTVFLQEPDIKNGVGGLRDYQNAFWMSRVKLDIVSIDELAMQNYVRTDDLAAFRRSYDFLLRVRNELHFMSARATDVMSLDLQPKIAENLGYTDPEMLPR